ncbi:hypothetical protein ACTFIZ_003940 [Dictyostelium cf. discoideum]
MNHGGMNMNHSTATTSSGDGGMTMGLKFTIEVEDILFNNWSTKSVWSYLLALIIVFFASGFLEFLNCVKQNIHRTYAINISDPHLRLSKWKNVWKYKIILMVLHVIKLMFHYSLMLIIMSFNLGLIFSVLAGAGLGYIVFLDGPLSFSSHHKNNYIKLNETKVMTNDDCASSTIIINSFDPNNSIHDNSANNNNNINHNNHLHHDIDEI